jgi:hypothetical protein
MQDWKIEADKQLRHDIIHDNKLLFKMASRPMTETCMCWGLEFNDGWLRPFAEAAYALEGLNHMLYDKYRVRVQSDQVKEKYGTLHWYTSVVADPGPFICTYESLVDKIFGKFAKLDFKLKQVVDREAFDYDETDELRTDEEIAEAKEAEKLCSNVKVLDMNGKFVKITTLHHPQQCHYVPTRHKIIYALYKRRHQIRSFLRSFFGWNPSAKQQAVMAFAELVRDKIVKKAETDCYNTCEVCGSTIGSSWSPRCETRGWITYICDECAESKGSEYYKDGALWKGTSCIKTKEQIDAERKAFEEKYNKKEDQ